MGDLSFLVWVTEWMVVLVIETENLRRIGVQEHGKFSPGRAECKMPMEYPGLETDT